MAEQQRYQSAYSLVEIQQIVFNAIELKRAQQ
jgi:hypothetical protein